MARVWLTDEQRSEIRRLLDQGLSLTEIGRRTGTTAATVGRHDHRDAETRAAAAARNRSEAARKGWAAPRAARRLRDEDKARQLAPSAKRPQRPGSSSSSASANVQPLSGTSGRSHPGSGKRSSDGAQRLSGAASTWLS